MSKIYVIGTDHFGGTFSGNTGNFCIGIVTSEKDAQLLMEHYTNKICSTQNLHSTDEKTYRKYPKIIRKDEQYIKISETGFVDGNHICFYYDEYEL